MKKARPPSDLGPQFVSSVRDRLVSGRQVRRTLPEGGRLHVDRDLPFLCVYRTPPDRDDVGTSRLVTGEASYLIAPGGEAWRERVTHLVTAVAGAMTEKFGAFLVVEIWAKPGAVAEADHRALHVAPVFEVSAPESNALDGTVEVLVRHLKRIRVQKQTVGVNVNREEGAAPPGMAPLLSAEDQTRLSCSVLAIAVPPVYRDERHDPRSEFPVLLKDLRRRLGLALRRAFYDFTKRLTTHRPPHYHELGRRAMVKAVWRVDEQLAQVSNQFDYLLNVTPINAGQAWNQFKASGFERAPVLHYLPLPFDPTLLKRQLFRTPVERVEDPALSNLFLGKLEELERKITMLQDRNTSRFLHGSLQLFGGVDDGLLEQALGVLRHVGNGSAERPGTRTVVNAQEFARRAEEEISRYREKSPDFRAEVLVTKKVPGVMVSRGRLLIGKEVELSESRVDPLLQHEVGTHLLTYYNGKAQPFRQLYSGLAGYEQLQEGLAVLSEFLIGGLSRTRLRQLAGRVVSVRNLEDGAGFVENFRSLVEDHGFPSRPAFSTVLRVHRGGGLTKDAIYLRGLQELLSLLRTTLDLELLFMGKMASDHLGLLRELRLRGVLEPAATRPLYLEREDARNRLEALRSRDCSPLELVEEVF